MSRDINFAANAGAVTVVGHYRTGTHWLCALMELYFGHPVTPRPLFYPDRPFLALFTHDVPPGDMGPRHQAVYLYRDPVDTLFSQSHAGGEDWGNDPTQIRKRTRMYGDHVGRWLTPGYCAHKTAVRYECMREDFPRVCLLFNQELNRVRIDQVFAQATREVVALAVADKLGELWPIHTSVEYIQRRAEFRQRHARLIWTTMLAYREWLLPYFEHLPEDKRWIL